MKTKTIIIGGLAIGAGVALYFLVRRKNTLSYTGPSYTIPSGSTVTSPGSATGSPVAAVPQVYTSTTGVVIRESPTVNDPWLGIFGGNVGLTITNAGTWIGSVAATVPDSAGTVNPATGNVYNWYQLSLASTVAASFIADGQVPSGITNYVREDYVTIK